MQKYLSLTGHVYSPASIIMNQARVQQAVGRRQDGLPGSRPRPATAAQRKRVNDDEARGIELLRKEGMTVTEKVDGEAFRKAVAPAYAGFAKEFGADNIAAIQHVK